MNHLAALLIAIAILDAATQAQATSNHPAAPPDPTWTWVEHLVNGQPIVVKPTAGASVHCRFALATDAYLFCDPDDPRSAASGWRFDRAQVTSVTIGHPKVNWHPTLLAIAAASGIALGAAASRHGASDSSAAAGGLVTALMFGAVGYPITLIEDQERGFGFSVPLAALCCSGPHIPRIMHPSRR